MERIVTLFRERAEQARQQIIKLEKQMAQAEEFIGGPP
jgi:hypothetical protein